MTKLIEDMVENMKDKEEIAKTREMLKSKVDISNIMQWTKLSKKEIKTS